MNFVYKTKGGICAQEIIVDIIDDEVKEVQFVGGCPGNHLGIAALVKGMKITDVVNRLSGITCGPRSSSCPDQLACALKEYLKNK